MPSIHGPISPDQADMLYGAANHDTHAALARVGIDHPGDKDIIAVEGKDGGVDRYISANPNDLGTILRAGTEQELGLPVSDRSKNMSAAARVDSARTEYQAAADSVRLTAQAREAQGAEQLSKPLQPGAITGVPKN